MKLFRPESLARTRRRIKAGIREDNKMRMMKNILREGFFGYTRDVEVYKLN